MRIADKNMHAFHQGIKCLDEAGNLMWANISIPSSVMQSSVGITVGKVVVLDIIHWHAI